MVIKHRMTVAEYLALPEEKPYLEYINGEVCPKMAPDRRHSDIADAILGALWDYRKVHGGRSAVEGGWLRRSDGHPLSAAGCRVLRPGPSPR